jgi:hypothetical protein
MIWIFEKTVYLKSMQECNPSHPIWMYKDANCVLIN